ncbi:TetR family transcriptional regulator [Kibdelosporangium aridum]|uniref:TetR family transcriptional regulator n=1 Tax=Kibdelosporangium aridum TaxID=2030 RepID=A0A428ZRY5_KIBAR|nr:TetR family transcriptional regulator [Kibdelosporangium aridum]
MAGVGYHHGDLRAALLDAAESLVRERGVDGWSLREVSARIGVSPSAAYHHFKSRDALVGALSAQVLARLGERVRKAAARARGQRDDPQSRVIALCRSYVRWTVEDPSVAGLTFGAHHDEAETPVSPHPHDVLAAELDRLVEAGGLTVSARTGAEFVVWPAVHGLATLLRDGLMRLDNARDVDAQVERLIRAVLTGLREETSPHRPQARSAHTEHLAADR